MLWFMKKIDCFFGCGFNFKVTEKPAKRFNFIECNSLNGNYENQLI